MENPVLQRGQIPSLDGLRAVSIAIVFASHAGVSAAIPGGFGVTVFFFLSGYLITTLLQREYDHTGGIDLGAFYMRRVLRLGPLRSSTRSGKMGRDIRVHRSSLAAGMAGGDPFLRLATLPSARSSTPRTPPHVHAGMHCRATLESLNRVIRESIKTRGSFPTDNAATRLIYLAIRNFEKNGRNIREWFAARNQFAIMFEERFNA